MRALLDTNVLIALLDANHVFHAHAREWFQQLQPRGWASCPITENGVVRIMTQPGYRTRNQIAPSTAIEALRVLTETTNHAFWPDAISIRESQLFLKDLIYKPSQITDLYLLALAIKNGGFLATFDSRISFDAVHGATSAHVQRLG